MNPALLKIQNQITPILTKLSINYVGVFGSYAKDNYSDDSDVDLVIDFKDMPSFFNYVDIKDSLEKATGKSVDICTPRSINKNIRDTVLKDMIYIYGK